MHRAVLAALMAGSLILAVGCTATGQTATPSPTASEAPPSGPNPPRLTDARGLTLSTTVNEFTGALPLDFAPFRAAMDAMPEERVTEILAAVDERTAAEIAAAREKLAFTTVELVTATLHAIEDAAYERPVLQLDPTALDQAAAVDAAIAAGTLSSPLAGIPTLVKGNIAVTGLPNDAGSWALADRVAAADDAVVARLRAAGVVVLGRSNLSEFANYMSSTVPNGFSARGGQTLSPVDPLGVDPLGSSTGSAVAVQMGLVPFALGSETAGSILSPATVAGVVGYRPGSTHWGSTDVVPIDPQWDAVGVLARSVDDARAVEEVVTGTKLPAPARRVVVLLQDADAAEAASERVKAAGIDAVPADERMMEAVTAAAESFDEALLDCGIKHAMDAHLARGAGGVRSMDEVVAWYAAHPDAAPYGYDVLERAAATTVTAADCQAAYQAAASTVAAIGVELERLGAQVIVDDAGMSTVVVMNGGPRIAVPSGDAVSGISAEDSALVLATAAALAQ